ncbi:transmembrane and coiled-coil domain-containing protein 3-like isoform X2 [Xenia sp. Carnegie-2017]|uniref:transmembrane and coiled-coil domain-containing protein 3-like isoform X2 n=1 Tax=Xenia sp. Carnegie-2017 TaxID=2897299 RepID=UPI001F046E1B|nr:transmembrane and coiled-coil domain-containing protein 3-like isoform X2 [Xenia sp. Carnegie-2017]
MQFGFLTTAILFCSVLTTPATGGSNPKYFFKSLQIPKRDYCTNVNELCQSQKKFSEKFKSSDKRLKNLLHPQIQTLHLVLKELNDTRHAIFASFNFLKKLLSEDSKSIANVKERVQARMINLENEVAREQMLLTEISKAEKDFNTINKKEKQNDTSSTHSSKMQKYIEEVLSEVSDSADKLEDSLEENVYSSQKGGAYEVVLRVNENEEGDILDSRGNNYSQLLSDQTKYVMTSLIDSNSNRYVLSKANDPTLPHEDRHLIQSLFFIIILSFIFVLLCNILHMPTMFGFVIMGMILGPTGLNLIQSTVQIETLGEFGVFLIIFSLGLEFSPDKIKKVWKVAVFGSTAIMITVVLCGVVWGLFFGIPARQSLFVAACLCLSSTPLVAKFISSSSLEKTSLHTGDKLHTNGDDYASPLLGILVMQDVHMGFLIAILPALAGHHGTRSARVIKTGLVHNLLHGIRHSEEALPIGWLMFELILAVIGVMIFGYFITKYFLGKFFRFLQSREEGSSELTTLGILSFCFIFLQNYRSQLGDFYVSTRKTFINNTLTCIFLIVDRPTWNFNGTGMLYCRNNDKLSG